MSHPRSLSPTPILTAHARERLQQRGLRERDVALVLECGTTTPEAILLTGKDVAREVAACRRRIARLEKLRGTALFVRDSAIVTVFRPDREQARRLLGRKRTLARVRPRPGRVRPLCGPGSAFALTAAVVLALALLAAPAFAQEYLGRLGGSPYAADSTANPYGVYGSRYSAKSIQNPYGRWGSPYSSDGVRNRFTTCGPRIVAEDGTYLGRLNANRFDPESVANPYGQYGSRFSPTSINNPYGVYGSRYSNQSPNNPFATDTPLLLGE